MVAAENPIIPSGNTTGRQHAAVNSSRITQRPIPPAQLTDPRGYQLSQVRRRFTPEERDENGTTILTFRLHPSDPDFPFDMDALHCSLRIPVDYPTGGKPSLRVTNPDMERGYQINIERGFDRIVASSESSTLLSYLNALDKQLENLLSMEKADTIKLVSHPKKEVKSAAVPPPTHRDETQALSMPSLAPKPIVYSAAQQSQAQEIRHAEVRQLEARIGRLPLFSKSSDGLMLTIPLEPRRRNDLPVEIQAIKQVKLIVPEAYNLTPCRIELVGVNGAAADNIETSFNNRAKEASHMSLFNHINYLSQNMHAMAKQSSAEGKSTVDNTPPSGQEAKAETKQAAGHKHRFDTSNESGGTHHQSSVTSPQNQLPTNTAVSDRSHIVVIPRPPEWDSTGKGDTENSDSSSESDQESEADEEAHTEAELTNSISASNINNSERGVLISFPHIELHGIELLEIGLLSITVKCDRCKDTKDIKNLQDNTNGGHARSDSCKKCSSRFTIGTQ